MTREEFSREVGLVFQEEWRAARRWALTQAFAAGVLTTAAITTLARLI